MTKTTNVKHCGSMASAYAERIEKADGSSVVVVRVYDDVAGHYVIESTLTEAQRRYVIGRTLSK